MKNEELKWTGWKDIKISDDLVGDTITRGSGYWEKEYRYIIIPPDCGYDNYAFLISEKLVHLNEDKKWWFSLCHDMNFTLEYNPELREEGKKYKRYKLTGYELFESVFKDYEVHFVEESEERLKTERTQREKRLRKTMGTVICGNYTGNIYGNHLNNYNYQPYLTSFFRGEAGCYSNHQFSKVQNVDREFVIMEMSKYHFTQYEDIINAYLSEYDMYKKIAIQFTSHLARPKKIVTNTENISEELLSHCQEAMEAIKGKLQKQLEELTKSDMKKLQGSDKTNENNY